MNELVLFFSILAAAGVGLGAHAIQRRTAGSDGEWGARFACAQCGVTLPRWFFLDKNTARGPVSFYRYPIPTICRICRHQKGLRPIAWKDGETEARYNRRSERWVAETVAERLR